MGLQLPSHLDTQIPKKILIRTPPKISRRGIQKESRVVEGHLMPDHVHMLRSIPQKYSVAQVVGFIRGKSAIHIARTFSGHKKNLTGQHFWARGYYVSTFGKDERAVREYIKTQEAEDLRLDQLDLFR